MKKIKSIGLTAVFLGLIIGGMYFIPINIGQKPKLELPKVSEEEQLLGVKEDSLGENRVEVPEIEPIVVPEPPKPIEEPTPKPPISEPKKEETAKIEPKKEEPQKNTKKEEEKKPSQKESKIGVDRKLISGVPGTMRYKGTLPQHSVKEKGSITISYTVNEEGNVVSAYRIDGLRDRNTINNAITLIKKYVKAEKSKQSSTGTYKIEFK